MALFWKSASIRSGRSQVRGRGWVDVYVSAEMHLRWGSDTRRLLSPWLVNPIIFYRGNPSDLTNGLFTPPLEKSVIGNINLQSLRRGQKLTAERCIPPTHPARDAFHPPSRARTHTHLSHCIHRGVSDTPSGVCTTPTVPACGRARAVFLPRLTRPRIPMKETVARGDVEEACVLHLLAPCKRVHKQPSNFDWLEMFSLLFGTCCF